MTPRQLRDAANRPWEDERPYGCACAPGPHGSSTACAAYNVLKQATCDHARSARFVSSGLAAGKLICDDCYLVIS